MKGYIFIYTYICTSGINKPICLKGLIHMNCLGKKFAMK